MPLGAARITLLAFSPSVVAEAEVIRKKMGVSAIGDAQVDTAQSKFGGASLLLDGAGDYLKVGDGSESEFKFGSNDFTIEGWIRLTELGQTAPLWAKYNNSGQRMLLFGKFANNNLGYFWASSGTSGNTVDTGQSVSANTWHHIALVRNGTTWTTYFNGTNVDSRTLDITLFDSTDPVYIGRQISFSVSELKGNVDELRVSNTARYTANFTPSTTPFANDDNTLLLLHMDGTDGSTLFEDDNGIGWQLDNLVYTGRSFDVGNQDGLPRAIAISNDGTRLIMSGTAGDSIYSYTLSTPWDISTATYDSVSISASNSVPSGLTFSPDGKKMFGSGANPTALDAWNLSTAWDISTASQTSAYDFSPEMTYCNDIRFDLNGDKMFLLAGNSSTNAHKVHQYSLSTAYDTTTETYDNVILDHSSETTTGVSFAFSYDGKKLFLISRDENIYEYSLPTAYNLTSASYTTSYDISNEHTDSFAIANNLIGTRLYILDEDTQTIHQYSVAPRAEVSVSSEGNAQVDTAQSKFGGASYLSTATDRLRLYNVDSFAVGTGDITIEGWIRTTNPDPFGTNQTIYDQRDTAQGYWPAVFLNDKNIKLWWNGAYRLTNTTTINNDTWYHIAVVRSSGDWKIYVDGTGSSTYTAANSIVANDDATIGINFNDLAGFIGNLDEFRISNTARYTANFTAPTAPFQNDDNTLLLLHMDGTDGSTTFVDDNGVTSAGVGE